MGEKCERRGNEEEEIMKGKGGKRVRGNMIEKKESKMERRNTRGGC